jgi:hypothetical protein
MNCYYHIEQQAVSQCSVCNKGLCSSCSALFSPPTCPTCYNQRIKSIRSIVIKELLIMYGLGLVLTFLLMKANIWNLDFSMEKGNAFKQIIVMSIFTFYVTSGIAAGWKTLTMITPRVFLIMPLLGWALYFLVKFILSIFVGAVMLPIRTVICFSRLCRLKTEKEN